MFYITSVETFCKSNAIDDAKRNEGLLTPEGVQRVDDVLYGVDAERNRLDIYRPKEYHGKLPVIISIHGGGWVYGNKEIMQFYCMSLAEKGFAVINFSYRLAPKHKHPAPLEDINDVFQWVLNHAMEYDFDTANLFALGDSVGANLLGLYCALATDRNYADQLGVHPPKGSLPKAVAYNCGMYELIRGQELLMDNLANEYLPLGGTDEEYGSLSLLQKANEYFPPCFIMTANGDFLRPQAKPFYERMRALGIPASYHCYGESETTPTHVFHINIKLEIARKCNEDECAFFRSFLTE